MGEGLKNNTKAPLTFTVWTKTSLLLSTFMFHRKRFLINVAHSNYILQTILGMQQKLFIKSHNGVMKTILHVILNNYSNMAFVHLYNKPLF